MKLSQVIFRANTDLPGKGMRGSQKSSARSEHFDLVADFGKQCVRISSKAEPTLPPRYVPFSALFSMDELPPEAPAVNKENEKAGKAAKAPASA